MANDSCDSAEIEPKLIAPVAKRLTISFVLSTSLISIGLPVLKSINPLNVELRVPSSFACLANSQ